MPRLERAAVLAHRGASAYAPENTLEAFDLGVAMGADALEFDLRPTADRELVALHDPTLERTLGDPRELARVLVAGLEGLDPARRPPTIDAILGRYGDSTRYAIELKDPDPAVERGLLSAMERHGVSDRVLVMSFEPACLERIKDLAAEIAVCQLYRKAVAPDVVLADLDRFAAVGRTIGRAAELIDLRLMEAARERDLAVYAYVVNEEAEMERLLRLGIAALITDAPDRARTFVDRFVAAAS